HPGHVHAEEEVPCEVGHRRLRGGALRRLAPEAELAGRPVPAVRAGHGEGHNFSLPPGGGGFGVGGNRDASAAATRSAIASGVSTKSVPASGMPVMIEASSVSARMSSGSRWWTSDFPQARAIICISMVIACTKLKKIGRAHV